MANQFALFYWTIRAIGQWDVRAIRRYARRIWIGWPNREGWVGRWRGVRTEHYTYARWYANERGPWLFDRSADPLEMVNLAHATEARPAREEMEERLHRWMEATHDPFEYGKRGARGFLDLGQAFADPDKYPGWGVA